MKILHTLLVILIPALGFAQNDLENKYLLDNKLEMLIPKSFHKMTDEAYKKTIDEMAASIKLRD